MDNRVRVGRDLLSGLPVGIIENILTHLPIRDAIRTSILSTKWRYRWATIPHLDFHVDEIDDDCLKTFVTRTLLRHEGPIHKFRLVPSSLYHCPETDQWLFYLSRKGIKELILQINRSKGYDFDMPCLYSFRYLTLLKLYGCRFGPPLPIFQGFLWLKSLVLENVEVPSDAIHSIVAHSPLLENLEYTYAENFELRVSAPNLKYFRLLCTHQQTSLCAPLLAKMSVSLDLDYITDGVYERKPLVCNYTDFLGGVTNLESLTGAGYFLRYLSVGIEFCQHPLVFNHLKIIALCGVDFQYKDEILVLVRLIVDASANLRVLQVSSCEENDESEIPGVRIWDSECPKNCTFGKLKVITMTCFHGGIHEMKFIKFLLESSPVLETMNIKHYHYSEKRILSWTFKLLSYCRASKNAKILFIKR